MSNEYVQIEIPVRHVKAVQDALVWASDEARHLAEISSQYPWSYKRYEAALDLLDAEVRQGYRTTKLEAGK